MSAPGGAIAIADAGGHLLYLERLDGTFPAAAAVSTEKARTAAIFQKPTSDFEDAIKAGRNALLGVSVMSVGRARTTAERLVALDTAVLMLIGLLGLVAAQSRRTYALDAALILALLSFVSTVAASRYLGDRRPLTEPEEEGPR